MGKPRKKYCYGVNCGGEIQVGVVQALTFKVAFPPAIPFPLTYSNPSWKETLLERKLTERKLLPTVTCACFKLQTEDLCSQQCAMPSEKCSVLNLSFPPFWHTSAFDVSIVCSNPSEKEFSSLLSVTFISACPAHVSLELENRSNANTLVEHYLERSIWHG